MTSDLDRIEYDALRATIRERGSVRMWIALCGLVSWGALVGAAVAIDADRAVVLVPLVVLAATFELSFFIHTGVERVGRYLQVFYEERTADTDAEGWETRVMAYGQRFPGGGLDPLFVRLFLAALTVDFLSLALAAARHPFWAAVSLIAHASYAWRIWTASRLSDGQRARDLDRFRALKNSSASK